MNGADDGPAMAEEPSQAGRLEAITNVGKGASDKKDAGDLLPEKPANGEANGIIPTGSETAVDSKPEEKAAPKERSTLKVGLIMFSLCVRGNFHNRSKKPCC